MKPTKKLAQVAGILFLIQLIPYYIGHDFILGSILFGSNYLTEIYNNQGMVNIAMLLELMSAFAFVGFSLILYQVLKKYNRYVASAYIGLRFVEFGIIVLSEIKLMSLLALGRQFRDTEIPLFVQAIGDSIFASWQWTTLIYILVFCVNACLFYYLLWKSKLVPGFIPIWGFVGAVIALAVPILIMFERSTGGMMMYIPIGFNELFLAIWLLIKGFNSNKSKPQSTKLATFKNS